MRRSMTFSHHWKISAKNSCRSIIHYSEDEHMDMKEKSTFIKVDKFDTVMSALSVIKRKLAEAQAELDKINNLKQEEDAAVQKWANDLSNVQMKVQSIESELMNEEY